MSAVPNSTNMTSGIRDNRFRGRVEEFLRDKITPGSKLSFVSAFFTIYAYERLKDHLEQIESLRFLFGEPGFVKNLDPAKTATKAFRIVDDNLELFNRLEQKRVAKECADWIRDRVEIRSVTREGFLHGKLYHIAAQNGTESALMGSSNFTVGGLGLATSGNNIELNMVIDSDRDRRDLKAWFDQLWNDPKLVKDVKEDVLSFLSQLYQNNSPEFIYYKTLYHLFIDQIENRQQAEEMIGRTSLFETAIWKALFEFQRDGVKGAINKIMTHNGCILADSVGLGKTFEALAVIKYFELRNERVLVLCPKKLRENWTVFVRNDFLNPFPKDRFRYDVLNHTDLGLEKGTRGDVDLATINWGNYDLVVIDESHNFRNNRPGQRDELGNLVKKSRYQKLMDDIIKSGVNTKVLLLSATPVNNDLKDLRNQIYFISADKKDAFQEKIGISDFAETIRAAQGQFTQWAKLPNDKRNLHDLVGKLGSDFFKLLDELTIARSRKHILKYYKDSVEKLGGFPIRQRPISHSTPIDVEGQFLNYDDLNKEISNYQLSLFSPSLYLKDDKKTDYEPGSVKNFKQSDRETFLIGMMKVNFLKRLESSIHSFALTMDRTIKKLQDLENKIYDYKKTLNKDIEVEEFSLPPELAEEEELPEDFEVGGKLKFKLKDLKVDEWLPRLQNDKAQLDKLHLLALAVTPERDAKMICLKELIAEKVKSPTISKDGKPNRKVLVFTAFSDTAVYLYNNLRKWATEELGIHSALVTGGEQCQSTYGSTEFNTILTHFSPLSKNRDKIPNLPKDAEIDLLIATDCISEGQNLQDCDFLVNYDIHWNPVRLIQRFGRIDRIGSRNHTVQMVNFWPTDDLNKYINLKHRVEARMALVDIASTTTDNVLDSNTPEGIEELIHVDLQYRDKQLVRLKDEVLDLEDMSESVGLNDFTLDDFRIDLINFIQANKQLLQDSPLGLYSVVLPDPTEKAIQPGVIFCLKQNLQTSPGKDPKSPGAELKTVNPLSPYFLVYVLNDGNVRLTFAQPKQILEMYRLLCSGQNVPHETLCQLFDQKTSNGGDMSTYSELLRKVLVSIEHTFKRRAANALQAGRGGMLPTRQEQATVDAEFDLVTWLVIKEGA